MVVDNKIVGERMEFLRENMGVSQKKFSRIFRHISTIFISNSCWKKTNVFNNFR